MKGRAGLPARGLDSQPADMPESPTPTLNEESMMKREKKAIVALAEQCAETLVEKRPSGRPIRTGIKAGPNEP